MAHAHPKYIPMVCRRGKQDFHECFAMNVQLSKGDVIYFVERATGKATKPHVFTTEENFVFVSKKLLPVPVEILVPQETPRKFKPDDSMVEVRYEQYGSQREYIQTKFSFGTGVHGEIEDPNQFGTHERGTFEDVDNFFAEHKEEFLRSTDGGDIGVFFIFLVPVG